MAEVGKDRLDVCTAAGTPPLEEPPGQNDPYAAAGTVLAAHPEWSDRRIADLCGLSAKAVSCLRRDVTPQGALDDRRIGKNGRAWPLAAGEVRARIRAALTEHPEASLRSIASLAGASHETVRNVRAAMWAAEAVGVPPEAPPFTLIPDTLLSQPEDPIDHTQMWSEDQAIVSLQDGVHFASWFDRTAPGEACLAPVEAVPLSRIYAVADEARRRAAFWQGFADLVEARARTRPPVLP